MKKLMVVMIGAILSVFLLTAVYAAAPDAGAGAQQQGQQGQQGAKSNKAKQTKRVKSKREKAKASVEQEAQKRRALIQSGQ